MSDHEKPGDSGAGGAGGAGRDPREEDVGSVGEEAAKLFGALADWARDSSLGAGADQVAGLGGLAAGLGEHVAGAASRLDAGIDTGAAECAYCPICRTVHVVRQASPEVRAHLTQAASSFLQAAAGFLATLPPPGSGGAGAGAGTSGPHDFERIDLDDDEPEGSQ